MDEDVRDFHAYMAKALMLATALDALMVNLAAQNQAGPTPGTYQALHLAEQARRLMAELFPELASEAGNIHPNTTEH